MAITIDLTFLDTGATLFLARKGVEWIDALAVWR